jgi:N6-adenosine-specific RNA methylase IME4
MKYGAILCDPPWRFRTWSETNQRKAASRYYALMTFDELLALPVKEYAAEDCALFLWAINPMLPQAFQAIERWGFTYKTVAFTWAKKTPTGRAWHMGLGYWNRQNTEQCLLATIGKPKRIARDVRQLLVAPRREHSRKPDEVYRRIERLVPGPYLEMFARQHWDGWDAFGDEIGKFGQVQAAPLRTDLFTDHSPTTRRPLAELER